MPVITPAIPFRRQRVRRIPPPPPVALTLVSAALEGEGDLVLRLTFDRAIDLDALDASQVSVNDGGGTGLAYAGADVDDTPEPQAVVLTLAETGPAVPGTTTLSASSATGIVAADDGGTWAGVTALELPYP